MDWTNGQTALLAAFYFAMIATVLGDAYTTSIGLAHGDVEGNSLMKWLFAKIGQAGAVFVSGVVATFVGGTIAAHNLQGGYLYFGIVAAGEGYQTISNYLKLKKAKVSLK